MAVFNYKELYWYQIPDFVKQCKQYDAAYHVIDIVDGDTFKIMDNGKVRTIRLLGIDTPEKSQPYGVVSSDILYKLIYNQKVHLYNLSIGRYRRVIASVFLGNVDIALYMISNGAAWVYQKYCPREMLDTYINAQFNAKQAKLGLWADNACIAPWLWRDAVKQ